MLRLERICRPHRGVCRFVVVGGVVTLTARLHLQLHRIRIEFLGIFCGQLEPSFGWGTTRYSACGVSIILSRGRVYGRRGYFPSCSVTRRSLISYRKVVYVQASARRCSHTMDGYRLSIFGDCILAICSKIR